MQAGDADIVACIGGDTNHVDSFRLTLANFSQFARDAVYPYGAGGPNASFAFLTAHYMRLHGATREDFGKLCVAQRANALKYPHALFKKPLTLEEYLAARPIAEPLHLRLRHALRRRRGFLVLRRTREAPSLPYVLLKGTIERHNAFASDPVQMRAGWALDRDELYGQAGVEPKDIDFVETYDDYPVISLMQLEDLGFCGKARTGLRAPAQLHPRRQLPAQYVRRPALRRPGGRRRRLSRHGEAIRQLTGEAGERSVKARNWGS